MPIITKDGAADSNIKTNAATITSSVVAHGHSRFSLSHSASSVDGGKDKTEPMTSGSANSEAT